MRTSLKAAAALLVFLPLQAKAVPILSLSSTSLGLGETEITFSVDPDDTPLSAFVLNFTVSTSEIQPVEVAAGSCWVSANFSTSCNVATGQFGAAGSFGVDQAAAFTVGTVRLSGLVPGALLSVTGNWTDGGFVDIPFSDSALASVVPEPSTLALLGLGAIPMVAAGRRRLRS